MTVFLIIVLVLLTIISLLLAFAAGYGQALRDQAQKVEESKENFKAYLGLLKSLVEYLASEEDPEPELEENKKPEQAE